MSARGVEFTRDEIAAYYAGRMPTLKQRVQGQWRGPCPIHDGSGPNFAVNPNTGEWYCHSQCNRGGSMIALEMALEEVDFKRGKVQVFRIIGRAAS